MRGSLLMEAVISLLLISILLVFGFEGVSLSLTQSNKMESKVEVSALLNFAYGYLSKYGLGNDVSNITPASLNNLYWNGNVQYPRIYSLTFENVTKTVSSKQIRYRRAKIKVERRPGEITDEIIFIFGL